MPQAVTAAAQECGAELVTSEILGLGEEVLAGLQRQADAAGVLDDQQILLVAVGTSDALANQAVVDLAARWSAGRGTPVRAVFATAAPRALDALAQPWERLPAVVALFLAPGLLLDQVGRRASELGVPVTSPLGAQLASLVLSRYDEALA